QTYSIEESLRDGGVRNGVAPERTAAKAAARSAMQKTPHLHLAGTYGRLGKKGGLRKSLI
ncbi:MAG: hypothetical protein ABI661_00590, partial [Gammaproteobacteria bacterium]